MKIASLELFKVPPRWLFLKISADDGLAGWGEPIVEGRADTVAAAVTELSHYLLGRNPDQIEDLWQVLYRGGFDRGRTVRHPAKTAHKPESTSANYGGMGPAAALLRRDKSVHMQSCSTLRSGRRQ
jgi:hypothetical protein